MELVFIEPNRLDADPFTTSEIIAECSDNEHESIVRILADYQSDFEEFGAVMFPDFKSENPRGGRPKRVYRLSEEQATLLITYLENTPIVRALKKDLVRQFFQMREELRSRRFHREQGKPRHRELTDAIQQRGGDRWAYKHHMDLCYKTVTGRTAAQLRRAREAPQRATMNDYLTAEEMAQLNRLKAQMAVLVDLGMSYQQIKAVLANRAIRQASA